MTAVAHGSRWERSPSAAGPILTEREVGTVAIEVTLAFLGVAALTLLTAYIHPLPVPLPGDSGVKVGLVALVGLPILLAAIRWPTLLTRHLPVVAWAGSVSLTLDALATGPTFAPFVTMSYLWLALLANVFLSRAGARAVVVGIAAQYALVLWIQSDNPAPVTQWCLVVTAVAVTGVLGSALVDSVQTLAVNEHALRDEVERTRGELELAGRRKSRFLASMSHELRTPLNAIIGFTEMIASGLRGPLNAKQAEYVDDIRASGEHLGALIGEVLDVEAVETGREELRITLVELSPLLASSVALFREQAERQQVQIRLLIGADHPTVQGDERKIRQIVLNLLSNALNHTGPGGEVRLECDVDGPTVRIGVIDTGTGIDVADHERIFEEFTQSVPRAGGTGLGLPLSRRLARQHGGDLTVASALGAGSAFWLLLPVVGPRSTARDRARPRPVLPRRTALHVTPRSTAEMLGAVTLFLLLPAALLSLPRPLPDDFHPLALSIVVVAAILYRIALQLSRLSPERKALQFTVMGAVSITLAAACVGPHLSPFVVMFYVWIGTTAVAYLSTRAALAMLGLTGVCYAVLLVVQEGHALPLVRWELTMGTVALAAIVMRRMVDRLWEIAQDERVARKEIEGVNAELDVAFRHKSAFVANMSHELRTPLNVIIGFAEVLASEAFGSLDDDQAEYIDEILESARQLLALINDVLDLGKLEAGRMERFPRALTVAELVRPAIDAAGAVASARGVTVASDVRDGGVVLELDEASVRRAVDALLTSAVDATPAGETVAVDIAVTTESMVVNVIDAAPVVTPDDRRELLEEMTAAAGRDTKQALRLALAERFATLNGGELTVAPTGAVGNRWTFTVPAPIMSHR